MHDPTADLPYALGGPAGSGAIKLSPDDFIVEEILGFEPSGDGEHVFLLIEKQGDNTDYVARQLGRFAKVSARNISYAGLKDRHGRTRQWFSIQLPGQTGPDWREMETDSLRVLTITRNARKLRRGAASGNRFQLTLRDLNVQPEVLEARLQAIRQRGVPNYFGPQRFGHEGQNLDQARALFADPERRIDPHKRGLYLSAARSEIFNRILAERVRQDNWDQPIAGDVFMFPDSKSFFKPAELDDDIHARVAAKTIHPSGVLWGTTASTASDAALAIEQAIAGHTADLAAGLAAAGLETTRRPLRLYPESLGWQSPEPDCLQLDFCLPAGAYATTVIRELILTHGVEV